MSTAEIARAVIDTNVFMTLGTIGEDGRPWTSPVFFATADYIEFYWLSATDAVHSVNLERRPDVSVVIFNSAVRPNEAMAQAVYLTGQARQVTGPDVVRGLEIYPGPPERGARAFAVDEVSPPEPFRLYRVRAARHWILCPRDRGEPCAEHGIAHDHRVSVTL
jgi:hypothetical protein